MYVIKAFVYSLLMLTVMIFGCKNKNSIEVKRITYEKPIFNNDDLIKLELIGSIKLDQVENQIIGDIVSMDIDDKNLIYCLDKKENKIFVFNEMGRLIKNFGGTGYGPEELYFARSICVIKDRIYISELNRGVKIFDLNGKYINFIPAKVAENAFFYKPWKENYFIVSKLRPPNINSAEQHWEIVRYDGSLKLINQICEIKINKLKDHQFQPFDVLPINENGEVFYPYKRDEYIISKFDINGILLAMFGRKYNRKEYSFETRTLYTDIYKYAIQKGELSATLPQYPPIVRSMFIDGKEYLWVIVGEWYYDNIFRWEMKGTIDIYNSKGLYLYTFESSEITPKMIFKNKKLFTFPGPANNYSINIYNIYYDKLLL